MKGETGQRGTDGHVGIPGKKVGCFQYMSHLIFTIVVLWLLYIRSLRSLNAAIPSHACLRESRLCLYNYYLLCYH